MKLNLSHKEEIFAEYVKYIFSYVFQALLFVFLITLLLQQFYPNQVKSYVNINWFMIIVIIFGAVSIIFPPQPVIKKEKPANWKHFSFIGLLGILGGIIIFLKIKNLGWIGYVISILGGLIIIFLSYLVLTEKDE
jgi:hypothetical protein